jgi:cell division protein FtsL
VIHKQAKLIELLEEISTKLDKIIDNQKKEKEDAKPKPKAKRGRPRKTSQPAD